MRIIKRFTSWQIVVLCLLALFSPVMLRPAGAQVDRQTVKEIPGVPAGYTIIDGDIQMPISFVNSLRSKSSVGPQAAFNTQLWPNGIVPFEFETACAPTSNCVGAPISGCTSAANQTAALNAMAALQAVANIQFQQCPNNTCGGNHIHIRDSTNDTTVGVPGIPGQPCQNASANNSAVGMQGGRQIINIVSWGSHFTIVHELMHSLGFVHEHQRPGANTFVNVTNFCNNVQGGCMGTTYTGQFAIGNGATVYGYYDFDSVMHYPQCAFSGNDGTITDANGALVPACPTTSVTFPDGGITISVNAPYNTQLSPDGITPWPQAIGQRAHLSALDRATVSFLYPFSDWRFLDCNYDGSRGVSNGSFLRPYTTFADAVANTAAGGTLWILGPCNFQAAGTYKKQITIRAAPRVTARLGG